jgi:drug/metabolite transporter (DMT)-like permease
MPRRSAALDLASTPTSSRTGLWWGLLGVAAFSFTVIFTRVAVGGLSPMFVGSARAVIAALLAVAALGLTRQRLPAGIQWGRLAVIAGGVVVGFPVLTSYALTNAAASHGAVVIALLPAATAVMAAIRARNVHRRRFGRWPLSAPSRRWSSP